VFTFVDYVEDGPEGPVGAVALSLTVFLLLFLWLQVELDRQLVAGRDAVNAFAAVLVLTAGVAAYDVASSLDEATTEHDPGSGPDERSDDPANYRPSEEHHDPDSDAEDGEIQDPDLKEAWDDEPGPGPHMPTYGATPHEELEYELHLEETVTLIEPGPGAEPDVGTLVVHNPTTETLVADPPAYDVCAGGDWASVWDGPYDDETPLSSVYIDFVDRKHPPGSEAVYEIEAAQRRTYDAELVVNEELIEPESLPIQKVDACPAEGESPPYIAVAAP
jgi:hypothetical protein